MLFVAAAALTLISGAAIAQTASINVLEVFNGDTLSVAIQRETLSVRLYGIDAPESGQHGNVAATRFLKRLIRDQVLRLQRQRTDQSERFMVIIIREGKESSVNAAMVANGYAWVNPQQCIEDVCVEWQQLESQARALKLGIWSGYDLVPPWEFDARQRQ